MCQLIVDLIDSGDLVVPTFQNETRQEKLDEQFPEDDTLNEKFESYLKIIPNNNNYYAAVKHIHQAANFNFGDFDSGFYFEAFRTDPGQFIYKRDELVPFLEKLRLYNQKIFLMTNSAHQYSNLLMTFAFGEGWKRFFDLIIYRSKKPNFFIDESQFLQLQLENKNFTLKAIDINTPLNLGSEYYGGNIKHLNNFIGEKSRVIYFGDDLFGDICIPKHYANWNTVAIVEELQALEIEKKWLGQKAKKITTTALLNADGWGNYFYTQEGNLSFWGSIIYHCADIAIPSVQRLLSFDVSDLILPHHLESQKKSTNTSQKFQSSIHLDHEYNHKSKITMLNPEELIENFKFMNLILKN